MPVCQYGTQPKVEWANDLLWITGELLCGAVPGPWKLLTAFVCSFFANRLLDINDLCATLPQEPLPNPYDNMIETGYQPPATEVIPWLWSLYLSQQWNAYCQCTPGPSSACITEKHEAHHWGNNGEVYVSDFGPKPVTATGVSVTFKMSGRAGGNYNFQILRRNSTDTSGTICVTGLVNNNTETTKTCGWPTSDPNTHYKVVVTTNSMFSGGFDSQLDWVITWTGCTTTAPTDPFVPPALPPPDPRIPDPPAGTDTDCCTNNTFELAILRNLLINVGNVTTDTNIYVHAHLPIDCPDCTTGAPSFLPGATHGPLTGESKIAISDLVGVRVQLVAAPEGSRELAGQPRYEWNMGWMSIMNGDSLLEEKRITRDSFLWLPYTMKHATHFTWTLRPGVAIEAIELEPLP